MMILKPGHSVTKTLRRVAEWFHWKGMVADTFCFYDTFMTLLKFSEKRIVDHILRFQWGSTFVTIQGPIYWGTYFMVGTDFAANCVSGVHSGGSQAALYK